MILWAIETTNDDGDVIVLGPGSLGHHANPTSDRMHLEATVTLTNVRGLGPARVIRYNP